MQVKFNSIYNHSFQHAFKTLTCALNKFEKQMIFIVWLQSGSLQLSFHEFQFAHMSQVFNPSHSALYSLTYIHIHAFTREPLTHLIDNSERRICASIQRAESEADEMINCQTEWMNEWVSEWIRLTTCCMMAQHRPHLPLPLPLSLSLGFYSEWMRLMRLRLLLLLLLHCSPALHFTHTPPLGRFWHNADDIPMGLGKLPVRANGGPN